MASGQGLKLSAAAAPSDAQIDFSDIASALAPFIRDVDDAIRCELNGGGDSLNAMCGDVLGSGGKRLRPALLRLCAGLFGEDDGRCVPMAAAFEMLHMATLIHDDVIDQSDCRRGQPSSHVVWGNRRAIVAGDYLLAKVAKLVAAEGDPTLLQLYSTVMGSLAVGELMEVESAFDFDATETSYYRVIEMKTAILVATVCEVGAVVAGAPPDSRQWVASFGRELGIAYQLADDALDLDGDPLALGKDVCADLREGKMTLPLRITLDRCSGGEAETILEAWKSLQALAETDVSHPAAEQHIASILEVVRRHGGVEATKEKAHTRAAVALEALGRLPDGWSKDGLVAVTEYVLNRSC